jgi:hypothetical protein
MPDDDVDGTAFFDERGGRVADVRECIRVPSPAARMSTSSGALAVVVAGAAGVAPVVGVAGGARGVPCVLGGGCCLSIMFSGVQARL